MSEQPQKPPAMSPIRQKFMATFFNAVGPLVSGLAGLAESITVMDDIKTKEITEVLKVLNAVRMEVRDLVERVKKLEENQSRIMTRTLGMD